MDFSFTSKEDLFLRVKPALQAKEAELYRLGFGYIKGVDVWNYLIKSKWSKANNLMLSDIVSDILHADNKKLDNYLKEKLEKANRNIYFDKELEIL